MVEGDVTATGTVVVAVTANSNRPMLLLNLALDLLVLDLLVLDLLMPQPLPLLRLLILLLLPLLRIHLNLLFPLVSLRRMPAQAPMPSPGTKKRRPMSSLRTRRRRPTRLRLPPLPALMTLRSP